MNDGQYTVLIDSRPIRFAFLIDIGEFTTGSDRFYAIVDAVVKWHNSQWSGRMSTIIFFSGGSLADNHWRLVETAYPDRIVAFAPIPERLLQELDERLNPCRIDMNDQTHADAESIIFRIDGGIGTPPTKEILRILESRNPMSLNKTSIIIN